MDRLPIRERQLLQAASVIGKDIAVPLLQVITELSETALHHGLAHLQATEFLSAAGGLPIATYTFRHILIQEAAYQTLLTSTRRQYHQQTAEALAEHFPTLAATQPELLAHHYTEAGCPAPAIAAWQRAGQQAAERSAHLEAIAHFTKGLALLQDLLETPECAKQELMLHVALGASLMITRGEEALEVEQTYGRAYALCQQVEDTALLLPVLAGLHRFYMVRAAHQRSMELGERLLSLAQRLQDQAFLLEAHGALSATRFILGHYGAALVHQNQVIARYAPQTLAVSVFPKTWKSAASLGPPACCGA